MTVRSVVKMLRVKGRVWIDREFNYEEVETVTNSESWHVKHQTSLSLSP